MSGDSVARALTNLHLRAETINKEKIASIHPNKNQNLLVGRAALQKYEKRWGCFSLSHTLCFTSSPCFQCAAAAAKDYEAPFSDEKRSLHLG